MRHIFIAALILSAGCATTYRPKDTGQEAFIFTLSPAQCDRLRREARTYRATEKTGEYISVATALVAGALVLIPELRNETAAQGQRRWWRSLRAEPLSSPPPR